MFSIVYYCTTTIAINYDDYTGIVYAEPGF